MIKHKVISVLVASCIATSISAAQLAPKNPYLADSQNPFPHGDTAQQDVMPSVGPVDVTRQLKADEIEYIHTGPAFFGSYTSSEYPDGKRVYWSNGLDRIIKIDFDTHEILSTRMIDGVPVWTEEQADDAIGYFNDNNEGFFALVRAFQEAQKLTSLASVYTLLDNNNDYYLANKAGYIEAFSDAEEGVRDSAIVLKRRFDYPAELAGQNAMGLNMTYDGWIVTVTDTGKLLAIKPDFSEYHIADLQHNEGAAEKATRPTGYGWVRNAPALDKNGGIYIASQEYMHKVIWTGNGFSTDEADGAWAIPYDNSWGHGTGSTPSLMGFEGEGDELVIITDGNQSMSVNAYWRNEIPADWKGISGQPRRLAGAIKIKMGEQNLKAIQSEQSVVVHGYGALVVNNQPNNVPWYLPKQAETLLISFLGSSPLYQPYGVEKLQWDTEANKFNVAWVNNSVSSPSTVPIVSKASNMVYLIGARDNQWTLEAMDWTLGKSVFHYRVGDQRYNPFFAGTLLDEEGRIHWGTPWGRVRLVPDLPKPETEEVEPAAVADEGKSPLQMMIEVYERGEEIPEDAKNKITMIPSGMLDQVGQMQGLSPEETEKLKEIHSALQ